MVRAAVMTRPLLVGGGGVPGKPITAVLDQCSLCRRVRALPLHLPCRMGGRREADHCSARSVPPLSLSACTALALSASESRKQPCRMPDCRKGVHEF